jgi:hypothetical protein
MGIKIKVGSEKSEKMLKNVKTLQLPVRQHQQK